MNPTTSRSNDALLASYWGKADPEVALAGADHHTVLGHSLDVAACVWVLVERNTGLRTLLARVMLLTEDCVAATLAALCALHDVGKIDTRFQRKAAPVADVLRPQTQGIARGPYDHGTEGFRQIEDDEVSSALVRDRLGSSAIPLLRAVCGHHGALPSRDEPDPSRARLPTAVRREDERARLIFIDTVAQFFAGLGADLPLRAPANGALVQRLAGLCAIADWLGSDVKFFPYEAGPLADLRWYWQRARTRAVDAAATAGLLRATPSAATFGELFPGYTPRDVQQLTEQVQVDAPALIIVEAEMGKGKTEAALSLAARFLGRGMGEGVTVALPTMATSNAMFRRVEDVVPRIFPGAAVHLALAHGRASRDARFQALVQRGLRAGDADAPEASVACARWLLNKKRILLAQVGVGTIDQALQAGLVVRHQFVRMFGLSRNVVIIDEVHAYDAYMEVLLEHLLAWLGALDVSVILLSATLPSERRASLARSWAGEQELAGLAGSALPDDLPSAQARPYPLVSVTTRQGATSLSGCTASEPRTVVLERTVISGDEVAHVQATAGRLVAASAAGARVVWIRNTVREAQSAYRAVTSCAAGVEHTLFHARFRGCDRADIEAHVLDRFGKQAPAGGRVLVATQVVEQSLDLDFDELHSDLAPIDLLLQRVGRLHRHARARPPGFERPRLVVHLPSDADVAALRFGPSRYVYDAGTLWIADRALQGRDALHLPADIRPLVEQTYHPDSRAALIRLGNVRLKEAEERLKGELEARRTRAKQCCIPPTTADLDGGRPLDDDEDTVAAFTRDGMSATILPFAWDGAQGHALFAEDAAAWELNAGRNDAWRLASELVDQTLSIPARTDIESRVAASEAAAWEEWRRRFATFADESQLGRRVVPLPMRRHADQYKGWLRMGGKARRAFYSRTLGLLTLSEKDEELAR